MRAGLLARLADALEAEKGAFARLLTQEQGVRRGGADRRRHGRVNKHLDMQLDTPFGGAKQSGIGVELGPEGLGEFTQTTIIHAAK